MKASLFACMACAVIAAAGCAEKPEPASFVRIAPTIKTRVTGLHFDTGDRIGLTIVKASGTYVENRMMAYNGTAFTSEGLLWYNDLKEESTLTAYYPYSDAGTPVTFSVAADQTAGTDSSDLLVAVKSGVTPLSAPVGMLFHHVMSQLSILITNNSDAKVTGVTLSGLKPAAAVDFSAVSAEAEAASTAVDIQAYEVTSDAAYRAVVVPQQAALTVTVLADDGKNRTKTIPAAQLVSGMRYDLAVDVNNIDIELSLSGDIDDWQDGGSLENGPNGGDTGDDGTLTYAGETYRTATIDGRVWMAENLRYTPKDAVLEDGIWYPIGGASSVPSQGMLYNYETATGKAVTRSGYVQGICPAGWHIPDQEDLAALMQSENRDTDFFCCSGYWIVNNMDNKYGVASKGYLMGAGLSQEGKCDCLLYTSLSGGQPSLAQISSQYGVTVRCVKNAQ